MRTAGANARKYGHAFAAALAVLAPSRPSGAQAPARASDGGGGAFIAGGPVRPPDVAASRACSFRLPICVHGEAARPARPDALLAVLASAERAWDVETGALALPAPDPDLDTGAYDLYFARDLAEPAITAPAKRDPRSRFDRASAYTLVDESLARGPACALDTWIAASVARASLDRVAPATDPGSARAEAAYLARLAVPCAMGAVDDVDAFQSAPELAIVDPSDTARFGRGAALFYWWLDASYGSQPGSIVRATWALSPTITPAGAARWNDEPDGFDVLRMSFKGALTSGSTLDDLIVEFGTSRALFGLRDNGSELAEARPLGANVAARFDWTIDWPATPRRLASPSRGASPSGGGVAPTGSSYVLVRHAGALPGARLRLEATWEEHAAIRWVAVKLDASGRERGRLVVPAPPRATEAQMTIAGLDDVDAILLVATNVGDPLAAEPFDPDDEAFEPHGWLLTLAAE